MAPEYMEHSITRFTITTATLDPQEMITILIAAHFYFYMMTHHLHCSSSSFILTRDFSWNPNLNWNQRV